MINNDKAIPSKGIIPNEFSPSLINYHIEHHHNEKPCFNQAEVIARQEEERRQIEEMQKKQSYTQNMRKIKENMIKYNETHQEIDEMSTTQKIQRNQMKEKSKEYNESIRQNLLQKSKRKSTNQSTITKTTQQANFEEEDYCDQPIQQSKILDTFSFQSPIDEEHKTDSYNPYIKNDINMMLIDHDMTNSMKEEEDADVHNKINQNLQMVKNFRKTGLLMMTGGNNTIQTESSMINKSNFNTKQSANSNSVQSEYMYSSSTNQIKSTQGQGTVQGEKNINGLQQRRYHKALKKLMIEQLQNKSVNIPSICSCGQLQRKIDSLIIGGKMISSNDLMNVDCANNCIYYQKPSEYHRALTDIIQSIRTLKIENK